MPTPHTKAPPSLLAALDPGWLFLIAGVSLIGATVLIPAAEELGDVRLQRDRALAVEASRLERIARYDDYLAALDRAEPSLVLALATTQLNQIPAGRSLILEHPDDISVSASVFAALDLPRHEVRFPARTPADSRLRRWTTDNHKRPWLIAAGALCLLIGLMPQRRGGEEEAA